MDEDRLDLAEIKLRLETDECVCDYCTSFSVYEEMVAEIDILRAKVMRLEKSVNDWQGLANKERTIGMGWKSCAENAEGRR